MITALPTPPTRADTANFAARADAFLAALPTFATETNATATAVDSDAATAAAAATAAIGAQTTATAQANAAAASAAAAAASAGAQPWVSGTLYAAGFKVTSPINQMIYNRLIAGAGTTDPSADPTNWGSVIVPLGAGGTGQATQQGAQNVMGIYAGMIFDFAGSAAPAGFLMCDGSAISRTTYATLFAVIGTTYGAGNGSTTFNVPDLRRRTTIGAGGTAVSGPANTVGSAGGAEAVSIAAANLPAHQHGINFVSGTENQTHTHNDSGHGHGLGGVSAYGSGASGPVNHISIASSSADLGNITVNNGNAVLGTETAAHNHNIVGSTDNGPGSATAINNMQPSLVVNKIIKV